MIKINGNWRQLVDSANVICLLQNNERLLATLSEDNEQIYAAQVYCNEYKNWSTSDRDFQNFMENGTWYREI